MSDTNGEKIGAKWMQRMKWEIGGDGDAVYRVVNMTHTDANLIFVQHNQLLWLNV